MRSKCKIVEVEKDVCTIHLLGADIKNIETSQEDGFVLIQNLDSSFPCLR